MAAENCGNCAFGVLSTSYHSERNCRRRAPIVFHGTVGSRFRMIGTGPECTKEEIMGPVTAWPKVSDDDFCGEWELQDAK